MRNNNNKYSPSYTKSHVVKPLAKGCSLFDRAVPLATIVEQAAQNAERNDAQRFNTARQQIMTNTSPKFFTEKPEKQSTSAAADATTTPGMSDNTL